MVSRAAFFNRIDPGFCGFQIRLNDIGEHVNFANAACNASADIFIAGPRAAVKHQRNTHACPDGGQALEINVGRALIGAVQRTDGHGQGINTALFGETRGLVRIGQVIGKRLAVKVVFIGRHVADLCLNTDASLMGRIHNLPGHFPVHVKVMDARIDHHAGKPGHDGFDASLNILPVVQVKTYGNPRCIAKGAHFTTQRLKGRKRSIGRGG